MIELSLSAFAWTGVVLLQAVVHYTVRTQKRKMGAGGFSRHHHDDDDDQPALDASPLVLDLAALRPADEHEEGLLRSRPRALPDAAAAAAASSSHAVSGELFQDEIDPLDGDEPPVFFELLSQTGCEMMRNVSIESIALEQINEDDHASHSQREPSRLPLVASE